MVRCLITAAWVYRPLLTTSISEVVLFVSGFGQALNDESFNALLSTYGRVVSCKVLLDIPSGKSKGCGLIRLDNRKAAEAAIAALHNSTLPGQSTPLTVKFADTAEEKTRRRARQLVQQRFNPMARPPHTPLPYPMMPGAALATPPMAFPSVPMPHYGGAPTPAGAYGQPGYPTAGGAAGAAAHAGAPHAAAGAYGQPSFQQMQAMQEAAANSTVPGQFTLYVGGLPQGVDEGTIYKMFSPYGAVANVKIVMDQQNPTFHKGFCFVNFIRYEEANNAIYALNGQAFGDKRLAVSFKAAPKSRAGGGGGGGGGGATVGGPGAGLLARPPGAASGGYTGPAMAATPYASYPPGYPAASGVTAPAAAAAPTAYSAAAYQHYPYGGSYQ